jgi:hypothetical protein
VLGQEHLDGTLALKEYEVVVLQKV